MFSELWTKRCRDFGIWFLLIAVGLVAMAPAARAETPVARLTLYEVDEALKFKPHGHDTDAVQARLAQASLLGTAVDVVALKDGTVFKTGAFVKADASSDVSLATLVGPVRGTVNLLTDLDPTRNSLDTLLITAVLDIKAELDLSPTASKVRMAPIRGDWRAQGKRQRGGFTGAFLIPFSLDGKTYFYLNPAAIVPGFTCKGPLVNVGPPFGYLCMVDSTEFVLGIPMTKALLIFSVY